MPGTEHWAPSSRRKNLRAEPRRATPNNLALFLRLGLQEGGDQWSEQAATQNNGLPSPNVSAGPLPLCTPAPSSFSAL